MAGAADCFVDPGTILVTRSGNVGRSTVATASHGGAVASDDLLRIKPPNPGWRGWVYAYLQSPQARSMMAGAHYGPIIKHLEPSHVGVLPVPAPLDELTLDLNARLDRIVALRDRSRELTLAAEAAFEAAVGGPPSRLAAEKGFTVRSAELVGERWRFGAANHHPIVRAVRRHLEAGGGGFTRLSNAGYEVWLPTRFRRIPAAEGVWLLGSSSLAETNPQPSRRIADGDFGDQNKGRVDGGWVLTARSGQVYGIIGIPVLATASMRGHVVSDDVMRIKPRPGAQFRPGHLMTAMSHPSLGRPLIKAMVYGSSIPHLEVADILGFDVVRAGEDKEAEIADLAERAAAARADADIIERETARIAGEVVGELMHRPAVRLVRHSDAPAASTAASEFAALADQWRAERPRGADLPDMTATPACRAVVKMGERAVRPILLQLKRKPEHRFPALHEITGANPVPPEAEGRIKLMAEAWIKWGRERGYAGEVG